ncbi:MAG: MYXO-CTERM sorting domain-containing protein, partial [Polyangiaceae bacterium]
TEIYTCTDEYIQPYETSIIPGAKNIELCDGFVGHFEFFYNPDIYMIMHDALTAPSPKDALEGPVETEEPGESVATTPGGSEGGALDDVDGKMPVPKAGCSAGGGSDGGSGAWLVLGALGLALHRRRRVGA